MTRTGLWLALLGLASAASVLAGGTEAAPKMRLVEVRDASPLRFERNQGQTDARVEYLSRGAAYRLFLTATEAVLTLSGTSKSGKGEAAVLRMRLVGANPRPVLTGLEELPGRSHYFIGNDPKKWRQDVPHYGRVRYRNVYPGIDLEFHGRRKRLEYDLVVSPGADPRRIRLAFQGARRIRLDANLNLVLDLGTSEVVQAAPIVYQDVRGTRRQIRGRYVLKGKTEVRFEVGAYDRTAVLVIDPVLVYSTYLGGSELDLAWALAADSLGNVYVTGTTESPDFPTAGNPSQSTQAGMRDAFVAKLDPSSSLVYSTYLGGTLGDHGLGLAVDGTGNAYITGETISIDFPTAGTPSQATHAGGSDAFIAKLSPTSALVYSTFLGGSFDDTGTAIAVDGSANAYISGRTASLDFPTAGTPSQPAYGGGASDAFITKLDSTSARLYSTYLGGSDADAPGRVLIAVDGAGGAYITGSTSSTDFPTAGSPSQPTNAGLFDAFVTKLGPVSERVYSTYLGGSDDDFGSNITLDAGGNAYVAGVTLSTDFPTAGSPSQPTNAGQFDAFVTKLAPTSQRLLSTYLGGSSYDAATGIAVDASGSIYAVGETSSTDFPTTRPIQGALAGGLDAFLTRMDAASAHSYSTYLGGMGDDQAAGVVAEASGNVFIAGFTQSSNFPTAGSPSQGVHGGLHDGFLARILEPIAGPAVSFFTVSPCRLIDTRNSPGPLAGPALMAGADRVFTIVGPCGVPSTARAVSVNLAVTASTAAGNLRLYPAGTPLPLTSAVNYSAGLTRANNAIVPLNASGQIAVRCAQASGSAHFILDVNGYFQ